jgi:L-2,4-diaminobutyric acid acetyltransferase
MSGGTPSRQTHGARRRPEADARSSDVVIRAGRREDGAAVWRLVRESRVLDVNSSYAYVLFLDHFGDTSVVAEHGGEPVGFVTGFRPPRRPEVIFVWQVAVAASMRGHGLARGMLDRLVGLDGCCGVRYLETTVTPTNAPSRALFASFARSLGADHAISPYFGEELFPEAGHEAEELHRIGPFFNGPSTTTTTRG